MEFSVHASIATKEPRRVTYKRQFPLMYLWPSIITLVIFVTALSASGDDGASGCPAGCSCSPKDGFVNSREVKCSYLGLSDIPAMLNSSTVHTLDLSNNEISILKNASFSNYSSLSTLILSYGKVEEIEINAFAELQMVRDIDLAVNKLQSFSPKIFSSNPVLEYVTLRRNSLLNLPSDCPILISTSISFLDLCSCSITTIHPIAFSRLPSLNSLDLSSNNLRTISVSSFENLPNLRTLKLHNNPWTCNCSVVELMQWLTERGQQISAHRPVKCVEGQQYRTLWTVADGSKPCCESKTTEPLVARELEFTTDMAVDLPPVSVGVSLSPETSPITSRIVEAAVTSEAELGTALECETGGWANLSWQAITLMVVFIILALAAWSVIVAYFCCRERFKVCLSQNETQKIEMQPMTHEDPRRSSS